MTSRLSLVILLLSVASSASEAPALSTFSHKGYQVDVQTVGGVTVQATLVDVGNANRVDVRVLNKTDKIVEIQPDSISLAAISPKDTELKLLSDKELHKSASRQFLFSNLLIGFTNDLGMAPASPTSPASEYPTTAALRPPQDEGHGEAARSQPQVEPTDKAGNNIDQLLLRHTIIFPNQSTMGSVFFKREGKLGGAVVYVWLGRNIFSLPFGSATPTSLVASVHQSIDKAPAPVSAPPPPVVAAVPRAAGAPPVPVVAAVRSETTAPSAPSVVSQPINKVMHGPIIKVNGARLQPCNSDTCGTRGEVAISLPPGAKYITTHYYTTADAPNDRADVYETGTDEIASGRFHEAVHAMNNHGQEVVTVYYLNRSGKSRWISINVEYR
jgi:hypothetical protein